MKHEAIKAAAQLVTQNLRIGVAVAAAMEKKGIVAKYEYARLAIEAALDKDVPGWRTKEITPARFK